MEIIIIPLIYIVEILFGLVMFREFESKEPVRFEYMHSSERGMRAFSSVMLVDIVRHFITVIIILILPVILFNVLHVGGVERNAMEMAEGIAVEGNAMEMAEGNILIAFVLLTMIELMGYITKKVRSTSLLFLALFMGYGIVVILLSGMVLYAMTNNILPALVVIAALIYMLVVVLTYRNVMKCEERKFYDDKV